MAPWVTIDLVGATEPSRQPPEFSDNAREFLRAACNDMDDHAEVVKASFINGDNLKDHKYVGVPNGLIMAVLEAYTSHRRLVLSTDDFETAILVQLDGRRYGMQPQSRAQANQGIGVQVRDIFNPHNYEALAKSILSTLEKGTSQDLTDTHTLIKFVLSTCMKPSLPSPANNGEPNNLFLDGAIPSVTLLGAKADWEKVGARLSDVGGNNAWDIELQIFRLAVNRLFNFFMMSFDNPTHPDVIRFWNLMCPKEGQTGWLAVFNFWDAYGNGSEIGYDQNSEIPTGDIKEDRVSPCYRLLDFHVSQSDNTEKLVTLVLGCVGIEFWGSGPNVERRWDTVRPVSGSFMFAP